MWALIPQTGTKILKILGRDSRCKEISQLLILILLETWAANDGEEGSRGPLILALIVFQNFFP